MSRNVTIFALVQILLIISGFFGLGIVMKMNGYPNENIGIQWNSLALFLRREGLFLLLVPVLWTFGTSVSQSRGKFIFTSDIWLILGVCSATTIICLFLYACINPFTRPLLIGR